MAKSDDNLEKGKMGFLDHLDELRRRLIHSAIAIVCFFIIAWFFSERIYNFLQIPVIDAIERYNKVTPVNPTTAPPEPKEGDIYLYTFPVQTKFSGATIPAGTTTQVKYKKTDGGKPSLVTSAPWLVGDSLIPADTTLPTTAEVLKNAISPNDNRLVIDTVAGGFNLYVKVSFYAAIFLAVPFLLYQIWAFVSPGLYSHEKNYVRPVMALGTLFFLAGAAFAYKVAFPRACDYLIGLTSQNFRPLIHADDYFELVTTIMLGLGLVFQIPTLTFVLARFGLVTPKLILKFWRYAVVVIMLLAAILTPTPDIANMLVFAAPMIFLYFLSVRIAWLFGKPRRKGREVVEPAEAS